MSTHLVNVSLDEALQVVQKAHTSPGSPASQAQAVLLLAVEVRELRYALERIAAAREAAQLRAAEAMAPLALSPIQMLPESPPPVAAPAAAPAAPSKRPRKDG